MTRARLFPALALALGVGLLLAAEGVARLFPEPEPPRGVVLVPHFTRIWTLAAGREHSFFRVSPDGLRVTGTPGPPEAPLILTTGDSTLFGDGVEDRYTIHDVMGASLRGAGVPARTGTLAVPGYSTLQTRAVLHEVGWNLSPSLLVVGNLWSDSKVDDFRDADLLARLQSPMGRAEALASHLALFRQVRGAVNRSLGRPVTRIISWPTDGAQVGIRRVPLKLYAANLQAILEEARVRGVGVLFLGLASRPMLAQDPRNLDAWLPYVTVQEQVAQAHGCPRVDARQVLAGQAVESVLVDDVHPTLLGYRLLGEALAARLVEEGWPTNRLLPREAPPVEVGPDPMDGRGGLDRGRFLDSL